jgi:mannitol operon transcriptional antiterminator
MFETETGLGLPEEEVAYLAMHIGAALERQRHRTPLRKRLGVVAGCGAGATSMLLAQIASHFPQAEVTGVYSLADILKSPPADIDAIISTVRLTLENVPCAVISPLVDQRDLRAIEDLLDLIPSVPHDDGPLSKPSPLPSLRLRRSAIRVGVSAADWRAAVRAAGRILLKSGYCENRYIDAMIRQIDTYGSYVVLQGGVAIPHARPNDGVIKPGMSLVKLARPVAFPGMGSHQVNTIIALALPERIEPRQLGFLRDLVFRGGAERLAQAHDIAGLLKALGDAVSG